MDKIRFTKLTESFGKSIINENFDGNKAAEYYLEEKDVIRECDELSVEHLETCSDMSPESILEMTEQCDGHEVNLEEESLNKYINEACKHINSCESVFGDDFVIDGGNINTSGEATKYFVEGIQKISEQFRLLEVKDIDMKNLYDIVHTKLTDDQIALVHNMIYNDGNFNYEPSFRNDVMEHLDNNDESSAAKLISGVYGKRKGLFEVVKQVGLTEARKVQSNGINLTANKNSVTRAMRLTEGYAVDTHKVDDVDTLTEAKDKGFISVVMKPADGDDFVVFLTDTTDAVGEGNDRDFDRGTHSDGQSDEFTLYYNNVEEREAHEERFEDWKDMGGKVSKVMGLTEDSDGIDVGSRVSFEHIVDGEMTVINGTVENAVGEFYDIRHEVQGTETGEKMMTTKKDDELTRLTEASADIIKLSTDKVEKYSNKEGWIKDKETIQEINIPSKFMSDGADTSDIIKELGNRGWKIPSALTESGGQRQSIEKYNDMDYEVWYEAPKGYHVVGKGEMKDQIAKGYFDDHDSANQHAQFEIDGYLGNEELFEGQPTLRKVMKNIGKFVAPFAVIAIEDGNVVKQEISIQNKDLIPAFFREIQKEFPNAEVYVEDSTGHRVTEKLTEAKLTEYADEIVHVYDDKEMTKMRGTGFVDLEDGKFKTEMKDGVESVLVKWDSRREDWIPSDMLKLAEASKNLDREYDSIWLQNQLEEHLRESNPSPRHRPAYEYLLSRINQSYPDGDVSMKIIDELLTEPRANDLIGMGFKEDLEFFWGTLS